MYAGQDPDGRTVQKRWTKVDPFALSDLAREYDLTAMQQSVYLTLAMEAEYRSREWVGTYKELAASCRTSRKTATSVVRALVKKGLVSELEPFHQGGEGRVRVLHDDDVVYVQQRFRQMLKDPLAAGDPVPTLAAPRQVNETCLPPACNPIEQICAIEQEEGDVREVLRQGGEEEEGSHRRLYSDADLTAGDTGNITVLRPDGAHALDNGSVHGSECEHTPLAKVLTFTGVRSEPTDEGEPGGTTPTPRPEPEPDREWDRDMRTPPPWRRP